MFPCFRFDGFKDLIEFQGDQLSWKTLYTISSKKMIFLKLIWGKPQKLITKFSTQETVNKVTQLPLQYFMKQRQLQLKITFPREKKLRIFYDWLTLGGLFRTPKSNFHAIVWDMLSWKVTKKPDFLEAFAKWVEEWHGERIANCQTFTLSAQTASALIQTLRGHALL